jgi:hypothetical protein
MLPKVSMETKHDPKMPVLLMAFMIMLHAKLSMPLNDHIP